MNCDFCMCDMPATCEECGNICCGSDCADQCAHEDKEAWEADEAAEREGTNEAP